MTYKIFYSGENVLILKGKAKTIAITKVDETLKHTVCLIQGSKLFNSVIFSNPLKTNWKKAIIDHLKVNEWKIE